MAARAVVSTTIKNLAIPRGSAETYKVVVKDVAGNPVPITNDTLEFVIERGHPGGSDILHLTNGPGGHSDPGAGETLFTVGASFSGGAESSPANERVHSYGVEYKPQSGNPATLLAGDYTIVPFARSA